MHRYSKSAALAVAAIAALHALTAHPCRAINIVIDYSRDDNGFFGTGNFTGQGAAARTALEAAATYFSGILNDNFSAIPDPPDFSGALGGTGKWDWDLYFDHPANGDRTKLEHQIIPANVYRIYAGGRNHPDGTLGVGGTSTPAYRYSYQGPFTSAENNYVQQTTADFLSAVRFRGQGSGYASWGGYISFDWDAATAWHYNHQTPTAANRNDFYSVAIHELAHALGFGSCSEWSNLATGSHFAGNAAKAAYGGLPPPLQPPSETETWPVHWLSDTQSVVLGTNVMQEASMDPQLLQGTRKLLTSLDAGGLVDIGWSINVPTFNSADFNRDGTVNAPDLGAWRTAFKTNANADADLDGDSDGNDLLLWQRRLGQSAVPASAPNGVPEPAGAVLLAWSFALRARRRAA